MDFLTNIAIPQSVAHYELIVFITTLSYIIILLYGGYLFATLLVIVFLNRKFNMPDSFHLSYTLISQPLKTKQFPLYLGIIPSLSFVFSIIQLMQSSPAVSALLSFVAFILLTVSLWILYSYKESIQMIIMLIWKKNPPNDSNHESENESMVRTILEKKKRTLYRGFFFLLGAVYLFTASIIVTRDAMLWEQYNSLMSIFFSGSVWLHFVKNLVLAIGFGGIGILYFYRSQIQSSNIHQAYLKKLCLSFVFISLILTPFVIVLIILTIQKILLNTLFYILNGLSLVFFFIVANVLYSRLSSSLQIGNLTAFMFFLVAGGLVIANDSLLIQHGTHKHMQALAFKYEKNIQDLKASLGISLIKINGEEIFNNKCSACHLFDQKKVGPPFNKTLPKYEGKKADLIAFILNPKKIDPDYPPMPNQGLKPAEADSVASYIIRQFTSFQLSHGK